MAKNVVVVGAQWGDEGKGKIVDWLTEKVDGVVRFNGGHNAGHTLVINGHKTILRLIPSGIMHPTMTCYLGNGIVFCPEAFFGEIEQLRNHGCEAEHRLRVSGNAPLVMPYHIALDHAREAAAGAKKIGTTGRGIGPTYEDKVARRGVRVADLFNEKFFIERVRDVMEYHNFELTKLLGAQALDVNKVIDETLAFAPRIKPMLTDVSYTINKLMDEGKSFLFEGAQGSMLDIDHGTYPYVTSSNTVAGAVCSGAGVGAHRIDYVLGITKAYCTRVGEGPFPTEIDGDIATYIRERGHEYGTVTKRPRRVGYLDCVSLNYARRVSGINYLAIMLLDVLSGLDTLKICYAYEMDGKIINTVPASLLEYEKCKPLYIELPGWQEDISKVTSYEELPINAQNYIKKIEELTKTEVAIFSVGPDRLQTIKLKELF